MSEKEKKTDAKKSEYMKEYRNRPEVKERQKAYMARYHEENKEKLQAYYVKNKEKKQKQKLISNKAYYLIPENKEKKIAYDKEYYAKNKEIRLAEAAKRYAFRRNMINEILLFYSCQNPNCKWIDGYDPCELDFHHVGQKDVEVGKIVMASLKKLADEINKCVVICRNCHARLHKDLIKLDNPRPCNVKIIDKILIPT